MFFRKIRSQKINKIKSNLLNSIYNFQINDPTTPDLSVSGALPTIGHLKFVVKDMTTQPKRPNELRAANCFFTVGNCISNTQNLLTTPIKKWASCNTLQINPSAGADLNAYYDRSSIKLFYYNFNNKNFYFGDSADVVTHELGHALLDAMRPDFWSVQSLEIWSFHEAFSDILAIFNLMSYDEALIKVLQETKGNLHLSNSVSRLAEEVGFLIRSITKDSSYLNNALRDPAIENFKYIEPSSLPKEAPNNKLAAECHSFGRVFSNAWYNIFVRIFNLHVSKGDSQIVAIKKARDISFSSLAQAIPSSPRVPNYYCAIAKCMVATASAKDIEYGKIAKEVFKEWSIINDESLRILSDTSWKTIISSLKKDDVVFKNKNSTIVSVKNNSKITVSDLPILFKSSDTDEDFSIEVANDSFYEFDNKGILVGEMRPNEEQIKNHAAQCVLQIQNSIGKDKMWKIENGILVRNFI